MNWQKGCFLALCVLFLTCVCFGYPSPNKNVAPTNPEVTEKALEMLPVITLYGKVLDQNGDAVPEAEVKMGWHTLRLGFGLIDDTKEEWITAQKDGSFKWTLLKGFQPSLEQIRKTGYEFIRDQTPFFQALDMDQLLVSTSADKPLLLYLRKRGETTFLLKRGHHPLRIKIDGEPSWVPNILPESSEDEQVMRAKKKVKGQQNFWAVKKTLVSRQIGFGAKAEYLPGESAYKITFIAPKGGGILASDKILYDAPAVGYQPEIIVTFHSEKYGQRILFPRKPTWLFIMSDEPRVYARLKLEANLGENRDPVIYFDSEINPYGERNFEEEPDMVYSVRHQLEFDAHINLHENKLAPKPDLPKLIKAAKENAGPESPK